MPITSAAESRTRGLGSIASLHTTTAKFARTSLVSLVNPTFKKYTSLYRSFSLRTSQDRQNIAIFNRLTNCWTSGCGISRASEMLFSFTSRIVRYANSVFPYSDILTSLVSPFSLVSLSIELSHREAHLLHSFTLDMHRTRLLVKDRHRRRSWSAG